STNDLWQSLEDATGKPVREFMSAWTTQTGYPIVTVKTTTGSTLKLTQTRYRLNATDKDDGQRWPVPIDLALSDETLLLKDNSAPFTVNDTNRVKLNRAQTGWYITRYDHDHVGRLAKM